MPETMFPAFFIMCMMHSVTLFPFVQSLEHILKSVAGS